MVDTAQLKALLRRHDNCHPRELTMNIKGWCIGIFMHRTCDMDEPCGTWVGRNQGKSTKKHTHSERLSKVKETFGNGEFYRDE